MNHCFCLALLLTFTQAQAQGPADTGTLILHKFAQAIGRETYTARHNGHTTEYDIHFKFVDRSSPVPLDAVLTTTASYEPRGLWIKGKTSRMSTISDSIVINGREARIREGDSSYTKSVGAHGFPIGGYSPGTVQMVLLQYWKTHGRPSSINILPAGTVRIRPIGTYDPLTNGQAQPLNGYAISGLIWGNELAWCDPKGQLVCLMTNDAEGDKVEMVLAPYENLLPKFISKAAELGMELFAEQTGGLPAKSPRALVIAGATLIDVTGKASLPNSVVIVEEGRISRIGKMGEMAWPANARVIHAEGKTLLPGLWDMHAHFEQAEWGPAYLAAGVTTVRDCGNEENYIDALKAAIDAHRGPGPHIIKAGLIDGSGERALGIVRATNEAEAIAVVQRYKAHGYEQIKIYSSVKPDVVKYICDEAHRLGLTVTGHIPDDMGLIQGIDSGMNAVNHITYVYEAMKRNPDYTVDLTDSTNRSVIDFLRTRKIVVDPTIGVFELSLRSLDDDIGQIEPAFQQLPLPMQAIFRNMGMPEARARQLKGIIPTLQKITKALYDAGVPIVAGTDMGFPGHSLHRELELYVEAGLTPLQAIQTATSIPAQVMGYWDRTGSIAVGKTADLVLIDGDPLKNIRTIRKIWLVIKDGEEYDPSKMAAAAGFGR